MDDARSASSAELVELPVLVPEDRLAEFYSLLGAWYQRGAAAPQAAPAAARGRPTGTGTRYLPLAEHLGKARGKRVKLSLAQIDKLLGAPLPDSARKFRTFWANSDTPQGRAWSGAGYRLSDADLEAGTVVFEPL